MTRHVEVRPGGYADSVALMLATRTVEALDGVTRALLAMATPLNLKLLATAGFAPPQAAGPDDLLVAIDARDQAVLDAALATVADTLRSGGPPVGDTPRPPARTVGAAARRDPTSPAGVALISVPGAHAFVEAMDALDAGLHPMIFSDHVPLAQEILLKDHAAQRDLLVMGPDCGTAIISGVGLGFANVLTPGPVSLVAASGTGAQQVCCLLDDAGVGVRHVLGVGGRDLSAEVAARSTLAALALLEDDPATEIAVVVSKPPAPAVADEVRAVAERMATPVVLGFVGDPDRDLTRTVDGVLHALDRAPSPAARWSSPVAQPMRDGDLRGIFCGGTLCAEARAIAAAALGPIGDDPLVDGHVAVDMGADRFTAGRPHPMIDHSLRVEQIAREGARPGSHVLLLDVVLGHAAHPDPAAELAPALRDARRAASARGEDLAIVVSLCGTAGDPQDRARQATMLQGAGAAVHASNASAARAALAVLGLDASTRTAAR